MPFEGDHTNDIGLQTNDGPICKLDCENGGIKSPEAIFEGGVQFFMQHTNGDRALAERVTRTNMKALPYWQAHPFDGLNGPDASSEEFGTVLARL